MKMVYYVPQFLAGIGSMLRISVEGELLKEIPLTNEGMYEEVFDVNNVGLATQEYLDNAHRILKILFPINHNPLL